jgi:hypothetical protein
LQTGRRYVRATQGLSPAGRKSKRRSLTSWKKVAALGVAAYVWPLADDAPVNLDSILNRYHGGHGFLELLFKVLMIAFSWLAIREAMKGSSLSRSRRVGIWLLVASAFVLANLDDFALVIGPLHFLREAELWDPANATTKVASVAVFYAALREGMGSGRDASSS